MLAAIAAPNEKPAKRSSAAPGNASRRSSWTRSRYCGPVVSRGTGADTVGVLYAYLNYQQLWRRLLFIGLSVLVPLAVFFAFSLRHEVKLDWTGTLWIAAVPALASASAVS